MSFKQKIWSVQVTTTPTLAPSIADIFGEGALAVTVIAPPRQASAKVEALFDAPPDQGALTAQLAIAMMLKGTKAPKLTIKEIPQLDWLKKVAEDFPPLPIARWTIHGAAQRREVCNRRQALEIDATNAFGTGEHPTTRGCLLMLNWILKKGFKPRYMLDMGCGSGVLAMAFAKSCHGHAVAVDMDRDSVKIAKSNAKMNGLCKNIRTGISLGYRSSLVRKEAPYDLTMSNIFARPLSHMAHQLKDHLRPGGWVILAGLLHHQAAGVLASHRMQKLYLVKRLRLGEWTILALKRRQRA